MELVPVGLKKSNTSYRLRVTDSGLLRSPAIDHTSAHGLPQRHLLAVILLFTLWLAQVRYPPLSYPAIGLGLLTILTAMAVLLPIKAFTAARNPPSPLIRHPALLPGFFLVAWVLIRWAIEGFPVSGASGVGTLLWTAVYFGIAFFLVSSRADVADKSAVSRPSSSIIFVFLLSLVGLICGVHAVWQYHFGYMESYQTLLQSLGGRAPDRTEAALLHHLHLRRVASIWGDPNTLATFSAVSLCASLELLNWRGRQIILTRTLATLSIIACGAAIFYTGSRGGALDALVVVVGFGGFLLWSGRGRSTGSAGTAVLMMAVVACMILPARTAAQADDPVAGVNEPEVSGWVWRSDTIRERLFYLQVGERMIKMAPLVGLGPGSVELYFGRLKPAEARETKYLHNWIAQTWAETGLIGLGLTGWFLLAITWRMVQTRIWRQPFERVLAVIFFLLIFDGLLQVSWNQRELMSTFGIVCGILIARTGRAGSVAPAFGWENSSRLLGFLCVAGLFALFETRYLASATSKQIALDAMVAGERIEAQRQWERATRWMPQDAEPYAARASMARESGQLSSARMLMEKALALEPDSAALHAQAAAIFQALRQDEKAVEHLTSALRLYPTHTEYNYAYAKQLQEQGNISQALQFAQRALKYNYLPETRDRYENLVGSLKKTAEGKQKP